MRDRPEDARLALLEDIRFVGVCHSCGASETRWTAVFVCNMYMYRRRTSVREQV
jgi:hypothetical protein